MKKTNDPIRSALVNVANKLLPPKLTKHQQAGKFIVLTERPEGMPYATYKELLRNQNKLLKQCKR